MEGDSQIVNLGQEESEDYVLYPNEPTGAWDDADFKNLVLWATSMEMSDLTAISENVVWIRVYGIWRPATRRKIIANQLYAILNKISHNETAATVLRSGGQDINFAYEVQKDRETRLRYRGNAIATSQGYGTGLRIVLRAIPDSPPPLEYHHLEPEIIEHAFPRNGLVLITGVMGSGKSTLIASILREIIELGGRHVATYEDPVEFSLTNIPNQRGPVSQSQVPQHISSFSEAIRNSTRSAPDVVLIGESRDPETMRRVIQSADTGVAAYTTVHTASVPQTLSRIINLFDYVEHSQIASSLISAMRLSVSQRLYTRPDGKGRIALREYLPFTSEIREQLLQTPVDKLILETEKLLFKFGQPIQKVAQEAYDKGNLTRVDYLAIMAERKHIKF